MKFDKPSGGSPIGGPDNGIAEAQRANMRAIFEDPEAYAEWRIRMGLERPPEVKPRAMMKQRVAALAGDLAKELQASNARRPRERWERAPARKLTPEELRALYAVSPPEVSDGFRAQNAQRNMGRRM